MGTGLKSNSPAILWTSSIMLFFFMCTKEYNRLAHGYQIDLQRCRGAVLEAGDFTHAASPALSVCANGEMSGLRFSNGRFWGRGTILFKSSRPVKYELMATLYENEDYLTHKPNPQVQSGRSIDISPEFLRQQSLAPDGSFTAKLTGVYFVAYLKISDAKAFPLSGRLSLIVN